MYSRCFWNMSPPPRNLKFHLHRKQFFIITMVAPKGLGLTLWSLFNLPTQVSSAPSSHLPAVREFTGSKRAWKSLKWTMVNSAPSAEARNHPQNTTHAAKYILLNLIKHWKRNKINTHKKHTNVPHEILTWTWTITELKPVWLIKAETFKISSYLKH